MTMERTSIVTATEPHPIAGAAQLALRVCPSAARWSLRLDVGAAQQRGQLAGFTIAQPLNSFTGTDRLSVKLGPDEWLLITEQVDRGLDRELREQLDGCVHSLVDVSHRNVAYELTGDAAAEVLNAGCPLDLDAHTFRLGTATRTIFGKVEVILMRRDQPTRFRLECWRSFARHVDALIRDAAKLNGYEIAS